MEKLLIFFGQIWGYNHYFAFAVMISAFVIALTIPCRLSLYKRGSAILSSFAIVINVLSMIPLILTFNEDEDWIFKFSVLVIWTFIAFVIKWQSNLDRAKEWPKGLYIVIDILFPVIYVLISTVLVKNSIVGNFLA